MSKTIQKIVKGVLLGLGGIITAAAGAAAGWIVYSKKHVNHQMKLSDAVETQRRDFVSGHAGKLSYYADISGKGAALMPRPAPLK